MKLTVRDVAHILTSDVDVSKSEDVKTLDSVVGICVSKAKDALTREPPKGYSEFERDQLVSFIDGLRHSHEAIRQLLRGEQSASSVDALTVARLQLESLYTLCFLLQAPENVRLFLKNGWKKKYIRYLLEREERRNLSRFDDYYLKISPATIDELQRRSFVTDEERRTIEIDELGAAFGPIPKRVDIGKFPTPMGVIEKITNPNQQRLLKRLYPEYQYLCSFAHGDSESSLFRVVSDPRSIASKVMTSGQIEDFYQREVLERPTLYSTLSALQVATEIAAVYTTDIELIANVTKGWTLLANNNLMALPIWEIRAKGILNAI